VLPCAHTFSVPDNDRFKEAVPYSFLLSPSFSVHARRTATIELEMCWPVYKRLIYYFSSIHHQSTMNYTRFI